MKEKENMSMSELEAIALDSSIKVPEGFRDDLGKGLDALAFLSEDKPAARRQALPRIAGIAASLALVAAVGLGVGAYRSQPKDTFSDPEMAYNVLEASFFYMSSKMERGVDSFANETGAVFTKTNEIMDNI